MDAKLVVVGGKASKGPISLRLPTIIGRSREAELTVAHPMVSRQHCKLFEVDGLLKIRDLGSLNGTFVGKEKVTEADLYPESQFTVGPLTFRVEYEYAGEIPAPAPAEEPETAAPQSPAPAMTDDLPDFLATAAVPQEETAQPEADPASSSAPAAAETPADSAPAVEETPVGSAPAVEETVDFSALGLDDTDQVQTEPQPASDAAAQEAAQRPQEAAGEASDEADAEPSGEEGGEKAGAAATAASKATAAKKGWWRFGKGKEAPAGKKKPDVQKTSPAAQKASPAVKPAAQTASPAAKPAAASPAPAAPAKAPPASETKEMPDFLAGAAESDKSSDSDEDILGFLE
jgi:hypothetical protein